MRTSFIPVALVLLAATSAQAATSKLNQAVKEAGFRPLRIQTTDFHPGQVLSISTWRDGSINTIAVCDQSEFTGILPITEGGAPTSELIQRLQGGLNITATIKSWLTGKADLTTQNDVTLQLSNVKTRSASMAAINAGLAKSQTESCSSTIKQYRSEHKTVGVVQSVLVADVVYTVSPKTGIEGAVGSAQTLAGQIQGQLGGSFQQSRTNTVTGKGLVIGIKISNPKEVNSKALN